MSFKLDDLLSETKGPPPALDLSKTVMKTKEDFDKAYEKVPEYKIRPEKVRPEDVTGEGPGGWRVAGTRALLEDPRNAYANPLPESMQSINMQEFYQVNIDWRMLTTCRPKTKMEEEMFSRYVDMGRLQLQRQRLQAERAAQGKDWRRGIVKAIPGRGSVPEIRFPSCKECGEEFCSGLCKDYLYQNYARVIVEEKKEDEDVDGGGEGEEDAEAPKGRRKKRRRRRRKRQKATVTSGDEGDDEEE
ncbi:uncharacterized protein LOC143036323 [Oratosquilla oratoria]|uniref:uncharacterized protein LOC143023656 n=1 Tax=Oratosquilla oratoria TaxID=337810 RepID=UPI003F767BE0